MVKQPLRENKVATNGKVIQKKFDLEKSFLLVSEDERLEKPSKKLPTQPALSATRMGSVMGKLQEEQIQQQINFYTKRTIQDMIDGVQTECSLVKTGQLRLYVLIIMYIIMIYLFKK